MTRKKIEMLTQKQKDHAVALYKQGDHTVKEILALTGIRAFDRDIWHYWMELEE